MPPTTALQDIVGLLALTSVFAAMVALGTGLRPMEVVRRRFETGPVLRTLAVALVGVPLVTLLLAAVTGLRGPVLAGLLLVGISPGAPLALRRSRAAGGPVAFGAILQVATALLSIAAVPLWILLLDVLYGARAEIGLFELARQVFLAQILPLACGAALAQLAPGIATRVAGPLLKAGGVLIVLVAVLVVAGTWRQIGAVPPLAVAASLAVACAGLGMGHLAGGPTPGHRRAGAILCALRNPGIALLIASTNAFGAETRGMIVAHVLVTALALLAYLRLVRSGRGHPGVEGAA